MTSGGEKAPEAHHTAAAESTLCRTVLTVFRGKRPGERALSGSLGWLVSDLSGLLEGIWKIQKGIFGGLRLMMYLCRLYASRVEGNGVLGFRMLLQGSVPSMLSSFGVYGLGFRV